MSHIDPELLALAALGERTADDEHVRQCAECSAELESLREVVALGRDIDDPVLVPPPPAVWASIAAATRDDDTATDPTPLSPARPNRRPSARWLLAAAAVGVVVGGSAVLGSQQLRTDPVAQPVASAALEPLPAYDATGQARVVDDDGTRALDVILDAVDPAIADDGYLEVWLLDAEASGMVSLGVMPGSGGQLALPDGLDLDAFPVVDISLEPFDGDPTHSGDSVVRGQLDGS